MERYGSSRDYYNGSETTQQQWHSPNNSNSINSRSSREEAEELGSVSGVDSSAVRSMITVMSGYAMSALLDADGRRDLKDTCAERLRQEHGVGVQYPEQAVLANLDWGIDGLEKAVKATNPETRAARLEHSEKMLQVAVMLDPLSTTAGMPNSFLSAWAHYYMALVWKLRNNDRNVALHFLEMFLLEPGQARKNFAPALWEQLFQPHVVNIDAWYNGELSQIRSCSPPLGVAGRLDSYSSSGDLEVSTPRKQGRGKEPTLAADQVMRLELLNKLYQESLDENTQQYAQYYKDWMVYEAENSFQGSVQGSPASSVMKSPQSYSSQETEHTQVSRHYTLNAASVAHSVGTAGNLDGGKLTRPSSFDSELDNVSEASYKDVNPFPRSRSTIKPIEELDERASESLELGDDMSDEDDDCSSTLDFERGAGVFLDGEELTEDELIQVWEEISEGRISDEEAKDFISRLTDQDGRPMTFGRLSELAENAKAWKLEQPNIADQNRATVEYALPASSFEAAVPVATPPRNMSPARNLYMEDEEAMGFNRRGSLTPTSPSPEAFSRMKSDSSRSSLSSHSSRSLSFQQGLLSREQSLVKPLKDYVCPITNQLFMDPVTLETGQTYERAAIKEWLDRGNTTCPITRQRLNSTILPNTNFVLKRLVDTWKEEHPEYMRDLSRASSLKGLTGETERTQVYDGSQTTQVNQLDVVSTDKSVRSSPSRRLEQKVGSIPSNHFSVNLEDVREAVNSLSRAVDLAQREKAARVAALAWVESKGDAHAASSFFNLGVVESLLEVLKISKTDEVLRSAVFLLSELVAKDEATRSRVVRLDSSLETTLSLVKNSRVPQSAVLLCLLKVPSSQLAGLKLVPSIIAVLKSKVFCEEESFSMTISPNSAAISILEQIVTTVDHRVNMGNAIAIVAASGVPLLMEQLESRLLDERISAVAVLWACLQADGGIRLMVAQNLKIASLVDLLHNSNEQARTVAIFFLADLIRLNRRHAVDRILKEVLREGLLNSMHVLMLHLQMSPLEHRPLVASILLQLDILAEPGKQNVCREEALEALVNALKFEDNSKVQLEAAKALVAMSGRFSYNGRPMTEAFLLRHAGVHIEEHQKPDTDLPDSVYSLEEEEKAADDWDKRISSAVLGNGRALIEALGTVLSSKSTKLARLCVVSAAWLTCALKKMPDSGLQVYARNCFLPSLVAVLQPGRDVEEKILASLCLYNLTDDSVGMQQLTIFAKDLFAPLRRLKRVTWTAKRIVDALTASPFSNMGADLWGHGEVGRLDASGSGETRALLYFKGHLYSGHADASIKVWGVKRKQPRLMHEAREHLRAVLCFAILEESYKLFSGSADKTVRVWALLENQLKSLQVIEIKEAVHSLAVNSSYIVVVPQGVGIKVLDANGTNAKVMNGHKHVQTVNMTADRLYCGCTDSSIQELDPETGTSVTVQSGVRSLRGKKAIYSLQSSRGLLYSSGTVIDSIATKIWSLATKAMVHFISSQMDARHMAISDDLIYLANNQPSGDVEVWLREKYQKVSSFSVGSKILSVAVVGDVLYTGSIDGILRAWSLN